MRRIPVFRFSVATYNVHKCVGKDGVRNPERVAKVIQELKADLVGLQEVDSRSDGVEESAQMAYLAQAIGFNAVAGPTIRRADGEYGNVLLTNWPVLESRLQDISFPKREPRGALDVLLEIHGELIRVVVTHLGLTQAERWHQAKCLEALLCPEREDVLILLGDMNNWFPKSRSLRLLHRCLGRAPGRATFPSRRPFLSLDRIWVRPQEALLSVYAHKSALARVASDHLPLKGIIGYEEAGRSEVVRKNQMTDDRCLRLTLQRAREGR
jgi:endonuclease/exonuclease/phosphatase family metal-dependent hydrolase